MFEFGRGNARSEEQPVWPMPECIRCGEAPRVDEYGYCGHCYWAVRGELEAGLCELREYLGAWALFGEWCARRGERIV
jgi:hypothetical protein